VTALLSDSDRSRRDKLIGMLGSAFPGERSNALDMLQRMASAYKLRIDELILADGNGRIRSSFDRHWVEQAEREAREAKFRAQRAEQAARKAQKSNPAEPDLKALALPTDWRERFAAAQQLNCSWFFLTNWETNFVSDLLVRQTRWPSPKQAVVILRILAKAAAFTSPNADSDWEKMA
jgi:hypothetical protein